MIFGGALFVAGLAVLWIAPFPWFGAGTILVVGGAGWFINAQHPPGRNPNGAGHVHETRTTRFDSDPFLSTDRRIDNADDG